MNQFWCLLQKHTGGRSRERLRERSTDTAVHARMALGKSTSSWCSNWQGMKGNDSWISSKRKAEQKVLCGTGDLVAMEKIHILNTFFALLFTGKVHPQAFQIPEPSTRVCCSRVTPKRGRWSLEALQETGNTQVHGTRWDVSEGPEQNG